MGNFPSVKVCILNRIVRRRMQTEIIKGSEVEHKKKEEKNVSEKNIYKKIKHFSLWFPYHI